MTTHWIGPQLGYHTGDPLPGDVECAPQPSADYDPDGAGGWVLNLSRAAADKLQDLATAYQAAITQAVQYTSVGSITSAFQATPAAIDNLEHMMLAFQPPNVLPAGFYWVAADNSQVPFTYADLLGLAQTIGAQGFVAFKNLQQKKIAALAATTAEQLAAITW
jgi:hypothetical protein